MEVLDGLQHLAIAMFDELDSPLLEAHHEELLEGLGLVDNPVARLRGGPRGSEALVVLTESLEVLGLELRIKMVHLALLLVRRIIRLLLEVLLLVLLEVLLVLEVLLKLFEEPLQTFDLLAWLESQSDGPGLVDHEGLLATNLDSHHDVRTPGQSSCAARGPLAL